MKTIKVQGWHVEVSNNIVEIEIENTNLRNMDTSWNKVKQYVDLLRAENFNYPPVILERYKDTEHYEIIDGAHRIKSLREAGINTVRAYLVLKHV